jgi:geranyl-CoA carboxylase alpha subunit
MTFASVLVANRGEIALRVMRTVRDQGMRRVAVYSDADARAPHVEFADAAVHIGDSPAAASYLAGDKIIRAALSTGAGAIHPGYGFLSENADFARAVVAAGLVFIGPGPEAIEVMGDKAVSKRAMLAAGVPCVPGYQGQDQSDGRLNREAQAIGFPLMVKAAAGGGGRGMRLVQAAADLPDAIRLARSEAQNAFGSGSLILERALLRPRHVEIQVFADHYGNVIHLGERDCSVQRRHQKVIEESPCPVMTPRLRERMGAAAVEAARAVNYLGAGTVEVLLDESGEFYFLEMNTRLQVEHPVTEMVTGLDLVQMQLEVAQGLPLRLEQSQLALQGCAMEVRLYAEDPPRDFLPSAGLVVMWCPPAGEGIRVDAGIVTGAEVSPYYDSMLAKIICRGDSRTQARQRRSAGT